MEKFKHDFWGISAASLGAYELAAYLTHKRLPTISNICSRRQSTRLLITGWAAGLTLHLYRHKP